MKTLRQIFKFTLAVTIVLLFKQTVQAQTDYDLGKNNQRANFTDAYIESLDSLNLVPDSFSIDFVGSGAIQKSVNEGADLPAATGLGVLFDEYHNQRPLLGGNIYRVQFFGQINVASSDDSLKTVYDSALNLSNSETFGESLLRPLVGKNAVNLELRLFFTGDEKCRLKKVKMIEPKDGSGEKSRSLMNRRRGLASLTWITGLRAKYIGSNRIWSDSLNSVKTTTNTFKLGIFHDFVNRPNNEDYNVILGVGGMYTSVRGDLGLTDNTSFRSNILGTGKSSFWGAEVFTEFRLKNIKAEFSYTFYNGKEDNIKGFSGGRMITTIGFIGGFPLKVSKKN